MSRSRLSGARGEQPQAGKRLSTAYGSARDDVPQLHIVMPKPADLGAYAVTGSWNDARPQPARCRCTCCFRLSVRIRNGFIPIRAGVVPLIRAGIAGCALASVQAWPDCKTEMAESHKFASPVAAASVANQDQAPEAAGEPG